MSTPFVNSSPPGQVPGTQATTRPGHTLPPPRTGSDPVMPTQDEHVDTRTSARLIVTRGAVAGTIFPITRDEIAIGRDDSCDLVINDITVSRYHADIRRQDDRYTITDSGSLNGVYLNRRPVQHAQLGEGDEIWIGKARFTFHLPTHSAETTGSSADPGGATSTSGAEQPASAPPSPRSGESP